VAFDPGYENRSLVSFIPLSCVGSPLDQTFWLGAKVLPALFFSMFPHLVTDMLRTELDPAVTTCLADWLRFNPDRSLKRRSALRGFFFLSGGRLGRSGPGRCLIVTVLLSGSCCCVEGDPQSPIGAVRTNLLFSYGVALAVPHPATTGRAVSPPPPADTQSHFDPI